MDNDIGQLIYNDIYTVPQVSITEGGVRVLLPLPELAHGGELCLLEPETLDSPIYPLHFFLDMYTAVILSLSRIQGASPGMSLLNNLPTAISKCLWSLQGTV